jgi:hypothetical protein
LVPVEFNLEPGTGERYGNFSVLKFCACAIEESKITGIKRINNSIVVRTKVLSQDNIKMFLF